MSEERKVVCVRREDRGECFLSDVTVGTVVDGERKSTSEDRKALED